VLARRTWRCRPWQLDRALGWGLAVACRHGFAGVVVACEPTGHRWRVVVEQASRLGLEAVCVQPLLVRRAREAEDFTHDKSDDKDALVIARLTTQLHCYLPEQPTAAWARLRHLGNRRVEQLTLVTAAQQRLRDTQPNADGALPGLMSDAGFRDVREAEVVPTVTGSISVYVARRE
jgi:transposase